MKEMGQAAHTQCTNGQMYLLILPASFSAKPHKTHTPETRGPAGCCRVCGPNRYPSHRPCQKAQPWHPQRALVAQAGVRCLAAVPHRPCTPGGDQMEPALPHVPPHPRPSSSPPLPSLRQALHLFLPKMCWQASLVHGQLNIKLTPAEMNPAQENTGQDVIITQACKAIWILQGIIGTIRRLADHKTCMRLPWGAPASLRFPM